MTTKATNIAVVTEASQPSQPITPKIQRTDRCRARAEAAIPANDSGGMMSRRSMVATLVAQVAGGIRTIPQRSLGTGSGRCVTMAR